MSNMMFRSEVELGKFLGSVDIIPEAYQAISDTNSAYELHTSRSGIKVLAFKVSRAYTNRFLKGEFELIQSGNLHLLDFISTKVNPSFLINEAAVELFHHLGNDIKELENEHINTPLIITGSGLGGYLAILSALRLHHAIDEVESNGSMKTKRPICITFGSPLVGDVDLQRAIAERPQWKFRFLNVVADKDPMIASLFSSINMPYKPFGTFLFCTESGGHAAFVDQDSVMQVLDVMKLSNAGSNLQIYDYSNVLRSIRRKLMSRGGFESGDFSLNNSLRAGITLQLREVGVSDNISNEQIGEIERKQRAMIRRKNATNAYDPTKKLNEMKISLTYMELYMKTRKQERGYYDSYWIEETQHETEGKNNMIRIHQVRLNAYWKKIVEDKDRMPQKEGAKLRKRWIYDGTYYRRIIEPLDIAKYYQKGLTNYIENRSEHYKLLEKWFNDEKKGWGSSEVTSSKAPSLTKDSCFWAHVEEALIKLRNLENGVGSSDTEKELENFENDYVMRAIKNYSVSPEIFLKGSSFMKWWKEYRAYKGPTYASKLAQYMNNEIYKLYE